MEITVTGIGLVSALGDSLEATWLRLLAGESGISLQQPFPELEPRPLAPIDSVSASVTSLTLLAAKAAIKDAGLKPPLPDCGVAIGSSRGCQGYWEELGRLYRSDRLPTFNSFENNSFEKRLGERSLPVRPLWLETLPNAAAIAAARLLEATGPVLAPMAACATGIWAIARACELIETGQCQRAIAGAVEAPITPLTLAGFRQMRALAKTGCYPFDWRREGLVLGEGGAVLVLESAELAKSRSARVYGQIKGFGFTADAYHGNAPEPGGKAAKSAIRQCLDRSHLSTSDIDYIHAHGTSTKLNDKCEARLIEMLFPQGVPVSSTKGATGHTLGASGALGAAFCLMALQDGILPPCVGCEEPEFDLDLVRVARRRAVENALCLSFGFGGQNAAIALRRASN